MRNLLCLAVVSFLAVACAADQPAPLTKDEARARTIDGKTDHFDWCAEFDWYGDGVCDEFCLDPDPDCTVDDECFVGGCSGQVCSDQPGVITTCEFLPEYACYQQATCERQTDGQCGFTMTDELAECLAPEEDCANGTVVDGDSEFVDSTDGKQCEVEQTHCVTNDSWSCPQLSPLPPDWCPDGTVVAGSPSYISSADGMECEMPSVHCVTNDSWACPMFSPLPPDYCEDGTLVQGPSSFISATDGMECEIPSVHCLSDDTAACSL